MDARALRIAGILFFLALIAVNIWFCWYAWSFDPEKAEHQAKSAPSSDRS